MEPKKKEMHANVALGNQIHADHFQALLAKDEWHADGWEVVAVNKQLAVEGFGSIPNSKRRPDWVIINRKEKKGYILDITTKYHPKHFRKGLEYVRELQTILQTEPGWDIQYIEDHWLDEKTGKKKLPH